MHLDGLPLYRQAALLGRFGGTDLSRNTLAACVVRVGQAVQPVLNLLRDALLDSPIVHGDATEVQVLKEPGRKAQAKSTMWVQMTQASGAGGTGPPIRLFGYSPSRSTQAARTLYEGMRPGGVLMSDGYEPILLKNSVCERVFLAPLPRGDEVDERETLFAAVARACGPFRSASPLRFVVLRATSWPFVAGSERLRPARTRRARRSDLADAIGRA